MKLKLNVTTDRELSVDLLRTQVIRRIRVLLILLGIGILPFLLAGCKDDDEPLPEPDVVELATLRDDLSTLVTALETAGLVDDLQGPGPFTVFAPTNQAFDAFIAGDSRFNSIEDLLADQATLTAVLTYHVLAAENFAADFSTGNVTTLQGEAIAVDVSNGVVLNGTTNVTEADLDASNGVVHIINEVLLPPSLAPEEPQDVVGLAQGNEDLSTLVTALTTAGLVDDLQGDGPFTVFAPTNDAFDAFIMMSPDFNSIEELLSDTETLTEVLTYHVIAGQELFAADIQTGSVTTLQGEDIAIQRNGDDIILNTNVNVITPDADATNGVVHIVDKVLVPPSIAMPEMDIIELASGSEDLSTLVTALTAAGLVDDLQADGPFTVFAPTNDAFDAFIAGDDRFATIDDLLADVPTLTAVLTYHVLTSENFAADFTTGDVPTLQGESISVDVTNGVVLNGNINVTAADIDASNGVVHLIDGVLLPPSLAPQEDIVTIAQGNEDLELLVEALTKFPDLVELLSNDGTFTVFAPTDDAFAALLGVVGQDDLNDIPDEVIRNILEYHVIDGTEAFAADLTNGQTIEAVNGENVTVSINGDVIEINSSEVVIPDVDAENGVVHVIDEVLVPALEASIVNTIVEPAYFNKNFSTLTAAVVQADLLNTLIDQTSELTLFAPDNAAFTAAGITDLSAFSQAELAGVLQYHVLGSEVFASGLPDTEGAFAEAITTLNGDFFLSNNSNGVFINGNTEVTVATNAGEALDYDNGVVHLIDRTLVPAEVDVVGIAQAAGFTELAAALTEAGLVATLQGDGPFTVFAPTNAAFEALYTSLGISGPGEVNGVLSGTTLSEILLYHVLGARVFSSDLTNGLEATTLSGSPAATFTVNINGGVSITDNDPMSANANVTGTDNLGTNGVVHIIDAVILPEAVMPLDDIVTIAQGNEDLEILVEALTKFPDLVSLLSNDGTFTVFAPTDDAFAALLGVVGQTQLDDIPDEVIRNILEYHVINGTEAFAADLTNGQTIEAVNGENVTVNISGDVIEINTSEVVIPDVDARNGVVHVIDEVLVPALEASIVNTIVEPAYFNKNFSTLTAAVVQADLLNTLIDQTSELTLFAPDNAAFTAAGITDLSAFSQAELAGVLQYHVLGSEVFASGLPDTEGAFAEAITTLNGDFFLSNNSNGVFINGNTEVTAATNAGEALDYDNGVVHLIDRTLVPAEVDVVGIAQAAGFTELAAALTEAGLVTTLQGTGPFTVFAPTNQAFTDLYDALGASVNGPEDVDSELGAGTLEAVLLYHVLGDRVFSSDLTNGLVATTLSGSPAATFTVNINGGVSITDNDPDFVNPNVTGTDNLATNGVVHIIDAVLLPVDL